MLQTEFYERTKDNLTGEEYAKVEHLYNSVQMDKDEFCREWMRHERDDKMIAELMVTINNLERKSQELELDNKRLMNDFKKAMRQHEEEVKSDAAAYKRSMEDFGRKIIVNASDDSCLYSIIEEEFGIDFIIMVKLEEDIDLEKSEREYLANKLKR